MGKNNIKTTPTITLTEHLSALIDDEAGSFEQRRVLDELKSNDELKQKLSSYALIGNVMRSGEADVASSAGFLAGIHEKLEQEEVYNQAPALAQIKKGDHQSANDNKRGWLRPVGGFALAASVAAIAVLGIQNYQQSPSNPFNAGAVTTTQVEQSEKNTEVASFMKPEPKTMIANHMAVPSKYKQADAHTRQLLKRYVDSHIEFASNSAFVPSVRVIAYAD